MAVLQANIKAGLVWHKIGQGSQFNIYANADRVVKVPRGVTGNFHPLGIIDPIRSYEIAGQRINDLVLPYEYHEDFSAIIKRYRYYRKEYMFPQVIIQQRVPEDWVAGSRIMELGEQRRTDQIQTILDDICELIELSMVRQAFIQDPTPSNFCLLPYGMKLLDAGTIWGSKATALFAVRNPDYIEFVSSLPAVFAALAISRIPLDQDVSQLLSVFTLFRQKLLSLYHPNRIDSLWGKRI